MFFWWLNLVRLYSLYKILYPKRRIESYSILGTIISPNKILLIRALTFTPLPMKTRISRDLKEFKLTASCAVGAVHVPNTS